MASQASDNPTYCHNCSRLLNDHGYDGLCYNCTHCQACKQFTKDLIEGLCTTNQYCIKLREYRKDIVRLDTHQDGNSGKVTITFKRPIAATEKVFEKSELKKPEDIFGFFKQKKQSELVSPFSVTTAIDSKTEILTNEVNFSIISKQGRYFTRMISGGNYDFIGGTEPGYYISLRAQENDERILPIFMKVLRGIKFACHISNYSINGYFGEKLPSLAGEREHAKELLRLIEQELRVNIPTPPEIVSIPDKDAMTNKPFINADNDKQEKETVKAVPSTSIPKKESESKPHVIDQPSINETLVEVPKKVVEAIFSDLADIRRKQVYYMIQNGYAYNEIQAMSKISYDSFIPDLAKSYKLPIGTIKLIISDWINTV